MHDMYEYHNTIENIEKQWFWVETTMSMIEMI